ncbi:hypothetical protein H920_06975 [Fukomys damarensis]|uniref:Uncharacterized protein n=1 Tax=Fukomys damarensis TaxID=885580 RepID=A0A091DHI5_FUKDA|nr:hypothetical protein H920_06975 [Fukomys damarensis]
MDILRADPPSTQKHPKLTLGLGSEALAVCAVPQHRPQALSLASLPILRLPAGGVPPGRTDMLQEEEAIRDRDGGDGPGRKQRRGSGYTGYCSPDLTLQGLLLHVMVTAGVATAEKSKVLDLVLACRGRETSRNIATEQLPSVSEDEDWEKEKEEEEEEEGEEEEEEEE